MTPDRHGRAGEGLHVRVTFADGERLRRLAKTHQLTLSGYLRSLINAGLIPRPPLEPMLKVGRPRKK